MCALFCREIPLFANSFQRFSFFFPGRRLSVSVTRTRDRRDSFRKNRNPYSNRKSVAASPPNPSCGPHPQRPSWLRSSACASCRRASVSCSARASSSASCASRCAAACAEGDGLREGIGRSGKGFREGIGRKRGDRKGIEGSEVNAEGTLELPMKDSEGLRRSRKEPEGAGRSRKEPEGVGRSRESSLAPAPPRWALQCSGGDQGTSNEISGARGRSPAPPRWALRCARLAAAPPPRHRAHLRSPVNGNQWQSMAITGAATSPSSSPSAASACEGHGRAWKGMDGRGRAWKGVKGYGRPWESMRRARKGKEGRGRLWTGTDGHGNAWKGMEGHGRAWEGVEGHGRAWKGMGGR